MNPLLKPLFFGKGVVIHDDFQEIQLLKSGEARISQWGCHQRSSLSRGGNGNMDIFRCRRIPLFFSNIPFCVCFVTYFFVHENGPCFFASTKSKIAAGE